MTSLDIYGCNITDISGVGRGCRKLQQLKCKNVTDLSEIGRDCSELTKLDISGTGVTDLSEIGRGCPKLTKLDISGTGVTDLSEIGRGCPKLTSLSIDSDLKNLFKIMRAGSLSSKPLQLVQSLNFECVSAHDSSCFARAPRSAQADAVTLPRALFL